MLKTYATRGPLAHFSARGDAAGDLTTTADRACVRSRGYTSQARVKKRDVDNHEPHAERRSLPQFEPRCTYVSRHLYPCVGNKTKIMGTCTRTYMWHGDHDLDVMRMNFTRTRTLDLPWRPSCPSQASQARHRVAAEHHALPPRRPCPPWCQPPPLGVDVPFTT